MHHTKFPFIRPRGFREDLFKSTNQKKTNCLWRPCLITDRDEMCNRYRGSALDSFCQDLIHLAKRFQRRRFKKLTYQNPELPLVGMFINGSAQNE